MPFDFEVGACATFKLDRKIFGKIKKTSFFYLYDIVPEIFKKLLHDCLVSKTNDKMNHRGIKYVNNTSLGGGTGVTNPAIVE